MQVAVFEQEASSGSLGAQEALEVTMTSDASFMTMMFSNLYTNQVLAASREPLCNAWDAMIDAGKADQFIDITFDLETGDLSIRDYGKGIPKDKIAKIYGVFGGSTKRTDSKTTGGFGLGSKAPWALVDSFRVTSRCEGNMSVYNMAKATLESEGKPMIIPMVDVACPVEDSGLLVQFRVPEANIRQVQDYLQYAVLMGGIKARFNGEEMQTIDMSTEPGSYTVAERWYNERMFIVKREKIFIRYGTVVYPILRVPGTEKAVKLLEEFMNILDINRVLIQAAPSSLGLTPARETLSSGPLTENGLTQLCVDLIAKIEKEITETLPANLAKIEKGLMHNRMGKSLEGGYRGILERVSGETFLDGMQRKFYRSRLGQNFRDKWEPRLQLAEHVGWKKTVKVSYPQFLNILIKLRHEELSDQVNLGKRIPAFNLPIYGTNLGGMFFNELWFKPALKKMHRAGIDLNKVHWMDGDTYSNEPQSLKEKNEWRARNCYKKASTTPQALIDTLGSWHISFYSGEFDENKYRHNPALKSHMLRRKNGFIVKVKASDDISEQVEKLTKLGCAVTDLRQEYDWDPKVIKAKEKAEKARLSLEKARETRRLKREAEKAAGVVAPAKPRHKNALGTLRSFLGTSCVDMKGLTPEFTTDNPKYYLQISDVTNEYITSMWRTEWLTDDEKDSIVIVRNGTETKMAEKRGAVYAVEYFATKLYALVTEPGYKKYFLKQRRKSLSDQYHFESSLFKALELLKIKPVGLDKLTHIEQYEKAAYLFDSRWEKVAKLIPGLSESDIDAMKDLADIKLDIPLVHKLKNIIKDSMLEGIIYYTTGYDRTLLSVLKRYPERTPALKQIVLAAYNSKESQDA